MLHWVLCNFEILLIIIGINKPLCDDFALDYNTLVSIIIAIFYLQTGKNFSFLSQFAKGLWIKCLLRFWMYISLRNRWIDNRIRSRPLPRRLHFLSRLIIFSFGNTLRLQLTRQHLLWSSKILWRIPRAPCIDKRNGLCDHMPLSSRFWSSRVHFRLLFCGFLNL